MNIFFSLDEGGPDTKKLLTPKLTFTNTYNELLQHLRNSASNQRVRK